MSRAPLSPSLLAVLALSDKSVFYGRGHGKNGARAVGEVVFNTAMSGYQEVLTDPSYHGQIINFTHPHIGNTGVNAQDDESASSAVGMVARQLSPHFSSWRASGGLADFMRRRNIVGIDGLDTRAITRRLRAGGAQSGCIALYPAGNARAAKAAAAAATKAAAAHAKSGGMSGQALAAVAATAKKSGEPWREGEWRQENNAFAAPAAGKGGGAPLHVVVIDCGIKRNIMRALAARGCKVTALPYGATAAQTLALKPAGVLFGNGPGDPQPCGKAQELARALLQKRVPLFGLCLGHQIICAALGGKTQKMKFGHHGANHPAVAANGRVLITSQNHGFVVDAKTLPANCRVTHSSLFDGSLQGVASDNPPCITFQGIRRRARARMTPAFCLMTLFALCGAPARQGGRKPCQNAPTLKASLL